ncbi:MAG TPA: DUF6803 family protein [Propionibacteriaceae bacterium]|nr:DUF6803 family protein [Propionibacteriaceae bacterium]
MTATSVRETTPPDTRTRNVALIAVVAAAAAVSALVGLLVTPSSSGAMPGMSSTHYMELLATNQPWNLLIFMATPVVLAEILAVSELALLFRSDNPAWVKSLSRTAGLIAGPVMVGILLHLLRYAVVPLTTGGGWRGVADVIAVSFYLVGAFPMVGITLVELGLLGRDAEHVRKLHATFVGAFLVVAHVAMIFGMLDPTLLWNPTHAMPGGTSMPGMNHVPLASATPR